MRQNITITLDKGLLRKVKHIAIERGTSISGLLAEQLARVIEQNDEYDAASKRAVSLIKRGLKLGGSVRASRDQLHER